ncbi:response regulator [gamma proteobacterium BDW918]|mgnify:FL=1|jgi:FixJ family two-component response regulator|uniref:Two-component system response regulator n=1 Tax=Zhongshania aliphaticivorans TaxID=1470434 RepID=A0A127M917_9GAMM|nr:response regulator transcription factor [Zhongshania aliphaticivorans]AMO69719.1 two-component system response regulator [Zhongshania aliphaticivorans]EIF42385.1 response regulator [gamma proteobacterium BDW918]|tara:strand:+ start:310 stop:927 length:618 start_codon:yes stop_codon:yes gene_type:complete
MTAEATVYLVEDDDAVRDSLQMVLESVGHKVASYSRADAFLEDYSVDMAGCMVLDIRMPGMNGMELQRQLNARNSILPIIFVTGHGDVPMAVDAMQRGAVDFVQKPYREEELLGKIQQAITADIENRADLEEKHKIRAKLTDLTPRETQVMELMIEGKANKVIAYDLDISQRTVEIHRARVMEKMGVRSLAHLVRMVMAAEENNS